MMMKYIDIGNMPLSDARKLAGSIENIPRKYDLEVFRNNNLLFSPEAELLNSPLLSKVKLISAFGHVFSLKVGRKTDASEEQFVEFLNTFPNHLRFLRSLFITNCSANLPKTIANLKLTRDPPSPTTIHFIRKRSTLKLMRSSSSSNFNLGSPITYLYCDEKLIKNISLLEGIFSSDERNRIDRAQSKDACQLIEYRFLFAEKSGTVRREVASNPNATMYKEYIELFNDIEEVVIEAVASNPNATIYKEYINLFTDESERVREAASHNPNAQEFK
jgi:hypothetical protein